MRRELPAVLMRGGTSKGLFVYERDLPPLGSSRDELLLSLLGSPDPNQIDGLGGATSSTSKVVAVGPSDMPGVDVEYLFAQVAVERALVDYSSNCGNLTAAVGPFAIEAGLVHATDPITELILLNRNTNKRIRVQVPVADGYPLESGDYAIAGVPGTGAKIVTEYLDPAGSVLGTLLPTGNLKDIVTVSDGSDIEVSLVDLTSVYAFVRASDVLPSGMDLPSEVNASATTLRHLEEVRAACARLLGVIGPDEDAVMRSPAVPRLALAAEPAAYVTTSGDQIEGHALDLRVRMMSMQKMHHALPGTGLLAAAGSARVPGTIPNLLMRQTAADSVRIGHPKGVSTADVKLDKTYGITSVAIARTARRLMEGHAYSIDPAQMPFSGMAIVPPLSVE